MASSKLVTTNPDLPRQSSICSLSSILADLQNTATANPNDDDDDGDNSKATATALNSMSMDDLFKSIYTSPSNIPNNLNPNIPPPPVNPSFHNSGVEIGGGGGGGEGMTLEDFLAKAGAVREEDVNVNGNDGNDGNDVVVGPSGGVVAGFRADVAVGMNGGGGLVAAVGGRGKRRVVEEPVDKATIQKQRRMIKNRESAARSRERKQAYTVELETMVTQLEAENAQLLRDMAERKKQRYKQLMENLIPVVEKPRPQRKIRRVNSAQW